MIRFDTGSLKFDSSGLIPAIIQDGSTKEVLMMAWMNEESLMQSLSRGQTVFYSRSRNEIWHKGATSGNFQNIVSIQADCDRDVLLIEVLPQGPACHNGTKSCFEAPNVQ